MNKIMNEKLDLIIGGSSDLTAPIVNAFVNVIKILIDVGKGLGSSIRHIAENNICPLN